MAEDEEKRKGDGWGEGTYSGQVGGEGERQKERRKSACSYYLTTTI